MNKFFIVLALIVCSACGTIYSGNHQSTLTQSDSFEHSGSTFMVQEGSLTRNRRTTLQRDNDPISQLDSISEACNHSLRSSETSEGFNVRCF